MSRIDIDYHSGVKLPSTEIRLNDSRKTGIGIYWHKTGPSVFLHETDDDNVRTCLRLDARTVSLLVTMLGQDKREKCGACGGDGRFYETGEPVTCGYCGGDGVV